MKVSQGRIQINGSATGGKLPRIGVSGPETATVDPVCCKGLRVFLAFVCLLTIALHAQARLTELQASIAEPAKSATPAIAIEWVAEPQAEPGWEEDVAQARQLLLQASGLIMNIPDSQRETTVANVAGQLARAHDLAGALATVGLLEKPDARVLAMGCIAWALVDSGNTRQALSLLAKTQEGQGRDGAYQQVAQLLVQKGDFEEGLRVARLIREPNRLGDTLVRLAVLRAKAGDSSNASRALGDALDVAEQATNQDPTNAVFNQIAAAQAEIGDTPETSLALRRFSAIAYTRRDETGDTTFLRDLAETEARRGDIESAMGIIQELPASYADWVYMFISQKEAERGSIGKALAAASKISEKGLKNSTLREIAMVRRNGGRPNDPLEPIDGISDPSARAEAIATLALQQAEAQDAAAYQTLQLWQVQTRGDSGMAGHAQETAAVAYGLLGDFGTAEQILGAIKYPESRTWPLWNLTNFLANKGRVQEALDIADQEEAAWPKVYALLGTAQGILDGVEAQTKKRSK